VRTVGVRLTADVSQYMTSLKRAGLATKDFAGALDNTAKAGKLDRVADSALKFGVVGAAAFGYVVKSAADFDKSMSAVSAAVGRTGERDLPKLRAAALQAGKDTQYSATQAADGITQLSKAGVSTANILGGGLKGALSLAAAGQIDVGEAAETAASAMTQFKLSGDKVPHVADLLAAAAGKAQGSVHDMGMALNQSGLVASQFGLSIEDTTGVLAEFANAGLIGSDAGTSFKTMLLAMANPSKQTQALMDSLNISFYDAQGRFIGLAGVADQLRTKLGGLTEAQRNQALGQIFGNDAIRAASILYQDGSAGVDKWKGAVNQAGYASETAAKLTDNLAGDIERLRGNLETLAIQSGSGANSGLRVLTQSIGQLVSGFGQLPPLVGSSVTVLAGLAGAGALGLAGFIKLRSGLASAVEQLNAMGPAGERAATGLQKGASAAGKLAAAFTVLQVAGAVISSFQRDLNPQIEAATKGLEEWARQCLLSGEAARLFGADSKDLDRALIGLASNGFSHASDAVTDWVLGIVGVSSPLDDAKLKVDALDQALAGMVRDGHGATALAYLQARAKATGHSVDDLKGLLPAFSAALETTGTAAGGAADGTKELSGAAGNAKGQLAAEAAAASKAADELDALEKATEQAFGAQMSLDRAAIAAKEGMADFRKEVAHGTRTLDINTAEGRKNRSAVLDQVSAIEDLRETRIKHGQSLDSANKKYVRDIDGLRRSMLQAGFTKGAVDRLIGSYRRIPPKANTHVTITGDKAVGKRLTDLSSLQHYLKAGTALPIRLRRAFAFDVGGWTGPGAKHDVAGVVHADEFVVKKTSRQKVESSHPGLLDHVNKTGQLPPGYADGGEVGWPFPVTARMTRIPSAKEAAAAVTPAVPKGGRTDRWIIATVHNHFPGLRVISAFRPGARTLSGTRSYHSMGRAVDFAPSLALARWWNITYGRRTKEEITPWRAYDIHNGRAYHYSAALHRQHSGGNAHVHIAMGKGGTITEPIAGVGASGRTYSFGEGGMREHVIPDSRMGGGYGATIVNVQAGYVVTPQQLEDRITYVIDRLRSKGRA
jgi:TP901 family phage tail tape measure protein